MRIQVELKLMFLFIKNFSNNYFNNSIKSETLFLFTENFSNNYCAIGLSFFEVNKLYRSLTKCGYKREIYNVILFIIFMHAENGFFDHWSNWMEYDSIYNFKKYCYGLKPKLLHLTRNRNLFFWRYYKIVKQQDII